MSVDQQRQLATWINALEHRVADLERGAQRRTSLTRRSATGTGVTTSGTSTATVCTDTFPDQGVAGTLHINALVEYTGATSAGDQFFGIIQVGGTNIVQPRFAVPAQLLGTVALSCQVAMPAGAGLVINLQLQRFFGSGTINTAASSQVNRIDSIFIPT